MRIGDRIKNGVVKYPDYGRLPPKNKDCMRIRFECYTCGKMCWEKQSSYDRKQRHFCSMKCYANDKI